MIRRAAPLLALALAASAQTTTYLQEIVAGRKLYEQRRFEEAVTHFARARALEPLDWRGHTYQALALIEQARITQDRTRQQALLQEAGTVASILIKNEIVLLQDPLYKFIRGVISSLLKDDAQAFSYLRQAQRSPRSKFAPYEEIELRGNVDRAYGKVSIQLATRLIMIGEFEKADPLLEEAERLLGEDDPDRYILERQLAAVSENLNRHEKAIRHLRRCIELKKGDADIVHELTSSIAIICFATEDYERGRQILSELPQDSRHPSVLAARATALYKQAMRDPEGEKMEAALSYHRETLKELPPARRFSLVEPFVELVLEKITPRTAQAERPLLLEAQHLIRVELDRRPECPSIYFHLYRLHKLLGDSEKAIYYQDLHKQKKQEWDRMEHYDEHGRPRCG
ncbi:MAG: hypothetical protein ACYTEZ_18850 [Planctomycetota bacterium]|jgi:tetratricopeptide (TPR) repeat protein